MELLEKIQRKKGKLAMVVEHKTEADSVCGFTSFRFLNSGWIVFVQIEVYGLSEMSCFGNENKNGHRRGCALL